MTGLMFHRNVSAVVCLVHLYSVEHFGVQVVANAVIHADIRVTTRIVEHFIMHDVVTQHHACTRLPRCGVRPTRVRVTV